MSACVIFNLLNNELGKSDKMQGLMPSILSLFRIKFNQFNKTEELMLDSIYPMTFKLHAFCNYVSCVCQIYAMLYGSHYITLLNL